jgi:DNA polymerase-1
MMFKIPLEKVTKAQRYLSKTLNFAVVYGAGARKLMDTLNEAAETPKDRITITRAKELLDLHKRTYAVAIKWLEAQGFKALRTGSIETIYGRKRYFNRPKFIDQESYDKQVGAIKRAGANSPVQGSSADITKLALIAVYEELHNYFGGAHIILQVHDEIVVISPKNQAEEIKKIMVDAMVSTAETLIKSVPITVSSDIGDYWEKH